MAGGDGRTGASRSALAGAARTSAPRASATSADNLTVVLRYERGAQVQPVTEALLGLRSGEAPGPVRAAANRLVRKSAPWALDVQGALVGLLAAVGDDRSAALWRSWSSWRTPRTLRDLATEAGVSAQRVGHGVHRFDASLRAGLLEAPGPLAWVVRTVRERLGPVATVDRVEKVLAALSVGAAGEAVVWLAGPYRLVRGRPGWLARDGDGILARTAACLSADGGVRPLGEVTAELELTAEALRPWLGASGAIVVGELAVSLAGPLATAVERILEAHGEPLGTAEIGSALAEGGRPASPRALTTALRQRRFRVRPGGSAGLADWAQEPPQAPAPKSAAQAGPSRPARTPGTGTDRGTLWLGVPVDAGVLRGADGPVPAALVEGLGMAGARRTFSSRYGPVLLAADGTQPMRGSVRAVGLAAGAREGDTLLLGFSAGGSLEVQVRPAVGPVEPAASSHFFVSGGA